MQEELEAARTLAIRAGAIVNDNPLQRQTRKDLARLTPKHSMRGSSITLFEPSAFPCTFQRNPR